MPARHKSGWNKEAITKFVKEKMDVILGSKLFLKETV